MVKQKVRAKASSHHPCHESQQWGKQNLLPGWWSLSIVDVALSPGHSQILSRSCGEKSGEGLGSLLCLQPVTSNNPRPSPNYSPRLQDKIWEWPGDEAIVDAHSCNCALSWMITRVIRVVTPEQVPTPEKQLKFQYCIQQLETQWQPLVTM